MLCKEVLLLFLFIVYYVQSQQVFATGQGVYGQLGNATSYTTVPISVDFEHISEGADVKYISAKGYSSYAIFSDNRMCGWGYNTEYEILDGTTTSRNTPTLSTQTLDTSPLNKKNIIQIASSVVDGFTLVLTSDGKIYSWGNNTYGQLGDESQATPKQHPTLVKGALWNKTAIQVAVADTCGLALTDEGKVYSWGYAYNVLGTGVITVTPTPRQVADSPAIQKKRILRIACKYRHCLALSSNGKIVSWGDNDKGQLGDGTTISKSVPVKVVMDAIPSPVVDIDVGMDFSIALTSEGKLYSWGANDKGQLGDYTPDPKLTPVPVDDEAAIKDKIIVQIATGGWHSVIISSDGNVFSWGHNGNGQLGIGSVIDQNRPVAITDLAASKFAQVVAGVQHTLFLSGSMPSCYGKVGAMACNYPKGVCVSKDTCECVKGYSGAECQTPTFTCFGKDVTTACNPPNGVCSGPDMCDCEDGFAGEECEVVSCFGKFGTEACSYPNGTCEDSNKCSCAPGYTGDDCSLTVCFGKNETVACNYPNGYCVAPNECRCIGYLGQECEIKNQIFQFGSVTSSDWPELVDHAGYLANVNITLVEPQMNQIYALSSDGKLFAWGTYTSYGLLCGAISSTTPVPTTCLNPLLAEKRIKMFSQSVGAHHILVLTTDGKVYGWGDNSYGQVGDGTSGTNNHRYTPIPIKGELLNKNVVQIAAGYYSSYALTSEGKVYSWGRNNYGQLGIDSASNQNLPTPVTTSGVLRGRIILKISAKNYHVLALSSDNRIFAWGQNFFGKLGTGDTDQRNAPVEVIMTPFGEKRIVDIEAGGSFSLAVTEDGKVFVWGTGALGTIGDGMNVDRYEPTQVYEPFVPVKYVKVSAGYAHIIALSHDQKVYTWGNNGNGQLGIGNTAHQNTPFEMNLEPFEAYGVTDVAAGNNYTTMLIGTWTECYGKAGVLACNHPQGKCIAQDTCECFEGYGGKECEIPIYTCYGKNSTVGCNPPHGKCTGQDTCLCTSGWGGPECEEIACSGKLIHEACSYPNGTCIGSNICVCKEGYDGDECEYTVCHGKMGTDACNYPNGDCVAPNHCYCYGFTGKECEFSNSILTVGYGAFGQLGNGGTGSVDTFIKTNHLGTLAGMNITQIAATRFSSYVLTNDDKLIGWGANSNYELSDLTTTDRLTPIEMTRIGLFARKKVKYIASSHSNTHNLALTTDGLVFSWGSNTHGQLGDGLTISRDLPALVTALADKFVINIASGDEMSFALTSDGIIYAWGKGSHGTLGVGHLNDVLIPTRVNMDGVLKGKNIIKISCKHAHILALATDGKIYAWGDNSNGAIGDGTTIRRMFPVATVMDAFGPRKPVDIDTGMAMSIAPTNDGRVYSWGKYPYLGDNFETDRYVPDIIYVYEALASRKIVEAVCGGYGVYLKSEDGRLYVYGKNHYGSLGVPSTDILLKPTEAFVGEIFDKIAAGRYHAMLLTGKSPKCFGAQGVLACSHPKGVCVAEDVCECLPGYTGELCDIPICVPPKQNVTYYANVTEYRNVTMEKTFIETENITVLQNVTTAENVTVVKNITITKNITVVENVTLPDGSTELRNVTYTVNVTEEVNVTETHYITREVNVTVSQNVTVLRNVTVLEAYNVTKLITEEREIPILPPPECKNVPISCFGKQGTEACNFPHGTCVGQNQCLCFGYHGMECQYQNSIFTTGSNTHGQLGISSNNQVNSFTKIDHTAALVNTTFTSIIGQEAGTFAISGNGKLYGWGTNENYELNDNTNIQRSLPIQVLMSGVLGTRTVKMVATSAVTSHTLVLSNDGLVFAWGKNHYGQLGDGSTITKSLPAIVGGLLQGKKVVQICAGDAVSMALTNEGIIYSWGMGTYGTLGLGNTNNYYTPQEVNMEIMKNKFIVKISLRAYHVLALSTDGEIFSWGRNTNGMLGDGTTTQSNSPIKVDMTPFGTKRVVDVEAGGDFSVALTADGSMFAWGTNSAGSLGDGTVTHKRTPTAVLTNGALQGKLIVQMSVGMQHVLALSLDGKVFAWGHNAHGQLGIGSTENQREPVEVDLSSVGISSIAAISTGAWHSILLSGTISSCYGKVGSMACNYPQGRCVNNTCECFEGFTGDECEIPTYTCYGKNVSEACNYPNGICNGPDRCECTDGWTGVECDIFICYGKLDTAACSWPNGTCKGPNDCDCEDGYTGDTCSDIVCFGKINNEGCNYPNGLCVAPDVCACIGHYGPQCTMPSTIYAAGRNNNGQLGIGSTSNAYTPTRVIQDKKMLGANITMIVGQHNRGYAISYDDRIFAWGANENFELADLTTARRTSPIESIVPHLFANRKIKQLASSTNSSHNLVLTTDGRVFSWGLNNYGQLGDGSTISKSVAMMVRALENVEIVQIATGEETSHALASDGVIYSWGRGDNYGLGTGSSAHRYTPYKVYSNGVLKLKFIVKISCKYRHSLALSMDGEIFAWGYGAQGRLGNGGTSSTLSPVAVDMSPFGGKRVVDIYAGGSFSAALTEEGRLFTWGDNTNRALGDGTTTSYRSSPYRVYNSGVLLNVKVYDASLGNQYGLALGMEGTTHKVFSWGANTYGQLGIGDTSSRNQPIQIMSSYRVTQISAGEVNSLFLVGPVVSCYGKFGALACNHPWGTCVANDTCKCIKEFSGPECATPIYKCFSKPHTTGCNAPRGQCVGPDLCKCTDGWAGQECQDMICHGKYPNVACSYPNGLCTGPNKCTCNTGWDGVECEIPICFGKNGTDACNYPNGECIGPDTCTCTNGYYGDRCQFSTFIYAAGYGLYGRLGVGDEENYDTFVKVNMSSGLAGVNVTQVIGLAQSSMAISHDGKLYGWGYNANSELYDGTTEHKLIPIALNMNNSFYGKKIKKIATANSHTHVIALTTDGEVYAWGTNNYGQLGDGSTVAKTIPIRVRGELENVEVIDIAIGSDVSFAHTKDGKLYSWGRGNKGLLGNGETSNVLTPTLIKHDGVLNRKFISKISCQHSHALLITYDLKAYAWGENTNYTLGDGTTTQRNEPVQVKGELIGKKVVDVSAGYTFSIAMTNDSMLYAWGSNSYKELGINTTSSSVKEPQMIYMGAFLNKIIVQIATGSYHTLVLTSDGEVYAWGRNYQGSLGLGLSGTVALPQKVPTESIGKIGYVSAGHYHSLILTSNFLTCFNKTGSMACTYPNGYCKDHDVCECNPGFEGIECEISLYSCYDKPYETACNIPHGFCVSHDVCECEYGYIGLECEDYTCHGKPSAVACSMHGKCVSVDNCECDEGWTGPECDIPICYGRTLTDACNYPNGECTNPDTCTCFNYVGKECTTPKCYDKMGTAACNYPHGSCIGPNTCQCEPGYFGDECNQYGCYGEPLATACNYPNGECIGPDECDCKEGYGTHVCVPICYGFTGPEACNGKGKCISPNKCDCNDGWAGNECDTPICFEKNGTEACSQNGICIEKDTCLCFDDFFGAECTLYINASTKEYPVESTFIEIWGQGFSTTLSQNSVTLQMGENIFPTCTITFANYTMIRCSVSGLSLGQLYGIVSVKGYASKKTQIATITGTVLVTESKELIPGYSTSLTIKGIGFGKNPIEMTVELSQYMDTPTCTVTASDHTWLSCSLSGLTNGPLFARVARNGIYSNVVQVATVDSIPPIPGKVKILPDYSTNFGYYTQSSRTTIAATWNEFFDSGVGISHYEAAIYDNYLVLRPFKNIGNVQSVLFTGLYLSTYKRYTVKVRAVDKFGYVSEPAESDPIEIVPKPLIPIEIPRDRDVSITDVYLQTFNLRLIVPRDLYENPYFNERLVLEPIRTFDNVTFMDPMETIPRMIGFTLTNPLTYDKFNKPLRVVISFLSVAHLLKPDDELILKFYDPWHKQWRRANETCREFDKEEIVEETDYTTLEHTATFCHLTQFSLFLAVNETFDNLTNIIGPPPGVSPPPPPPPPAYSSGLPPPGYSSGTPPPGQSPGSPPPGESPGSPPPGESSGSSPPPQKSKEPGDKPQPGTSGSLPGTSSMNEEDPPTPPPPGPDDNEPTYAGLDANTILLLILMTVIATIIAGVLLVNTIIFLILGRRGEEYIPMLDDGPTIPPSLPIMDSPILIPDDALASFRSPRDKYQVDGGVYERELEEIARPMNFDMYLPPPPPPPDYQNYHQNYHQNYLQNYLQKWMYKRHWKLYKRCREKVK